MAMRYTVQFLIFVIVFISVYQPGNARGVVPPQDTLLIATETNFKEGKYKIVIEQMLPLVLPDSGLYSKLQTERLFLLSKAYLNSGDKKKAYHYYKQYSLIKDSLSRKEREEDIISRQADLVVEKKDKEIAEQQFLLQKNERMAFRKNVLIAGSIAIAILLLLLSWISLNNFRKKKEIAQRLRKQMQQDREIGQLRSGVEGATEERQKITIQVKENIAPVIQEASDILNKITLINIEQPASEALAETKRILRQVKQSLIAIGIPEARNNTDKLYCAIQSFLDNAPQKQNPSISFSFSGTEPLLTPLCRHNLLRIIQELVQNIIKHSGASVAAIHLQYTKEFLRIDVKDNGKGYAANTGEEGMGLINIRQRVSELHGNMNITSVAGNYTEIRVPLSVIQPFTTDLI